MTKNYFLLFIFFIFSCCAFFEKFKILSSSIDSKIAKLKMLNCIRYYYLIAFSARAVYVTYPHIEKLCSPDPIYHDDNKNMPASLYLMITVLTLPSFFILEPLYLIGQITKIPYPEYNFEKDKKDKIEEYNEQVDETRNIINESLSYLTSPIATLLFFLARPRIDLSKNK